MIKTLTQGPNVSKFESIFKEQFIEKSAIAVMSAAHALDLIALRIKALTSKRTIVCPAHTYTASALGFLRAGFNIHLVDIDKDDWTINDNFADDLNNSDIAGIVVVHLYGKAAKHTQKIRDFCDQNEVYMIEDCAQAIGAKYSEYSVGQLGDFSCFSFHSQKNITTLGEGGMLVTDHKYSNDFRELRINGHRPFQRELEDPYWLPAMVDTVESVEGILPMKSTMSEAQGLAGYLVFSRYHYLHEHRYKLLRTFKGSLSCYNKVVFQEGIDDPGHARHLLPLRVLDYSRDELIAKLYGSYGIKAIVQYYPLNRYDLFKRNNNVSHGSLVNTDEFFDNMISIPFSATLAEKEMLYMANALNEILC